MDYSPIATTLNFKNGWKDVICLEMSRKKVSTFFWAFFPCINNLLQNIYPAPALRNDTLFSNLLGTQMDMKTQEFDFKSIMILPF